MFFNAIQLKLSIPITLFCNVVEEALLSAKTVHFFMGSPTEGAWSRGERNNEGDKPYRFFREAQKAHVAMNDYKSFLP